jgi:hypothetical protein
MTSLPVVAGDQVGLGQLVGGEGASDAGQSAGVGHLVGRAGAGFE